MLVRLIGRTQLVKDPDFDVKYPWYQLIAEIIIEATVITASTIFLMVTAWIYKEWNVLAVLCIPLSIVGAIGAGITASRVIQQLDRWATICEDVGGYSYHKLLTQYEDLWLNFKVAHEQLGLKLPENNPFY